LSLAWLLHQGKDIIPIFGTKNLAHLEENIEAASIQLTLAELHVLGQAIMRVAP
jgi:aryl-alcohol dehydrogenase-like predicted oxidoreductase